MGRAKLWLPFGPETMLQRVVRLLAEVVDPVVVVAAQQQSLPKLPSAVQIIRDEQDNLGPLGGLSVGLEALQGQCQAAFVSACDAPFLKRGFVEFMIEALTDHELAIPREEKYYHPLAAVYRTSLAEQIRALIAQQRLRPFYLVELARTREVPVADLRTVDPNLETLRNTNHPEDYLQALADAGFEPPADWNASEPKVDH